MKISTFIITASLIMLCSCARLPTQSIALTNAISQEGKRMHDLNVSLLNNMFAQKKNMVDSFIKNTYTPFIIENIQIPDTTDLKKEWPGLLEMLMPVITSKRETLRNALENQRLKLVDKLDSDYAVFDNAISSLKALLVSAIKVDDLRKQTLTRLAGIANDKIDITEIGNKLDEFIIKAGDATNSTQNKVNDLDNSINSLLNK
jgi:hypothetical protein